MAEQFLKLIIEKNPFLEAILITDKEGIEIYTAYKTDNHPIKENQNGLIFTTAFDQTNDHITKLNQGKAKSLTLFYDNYIVYQEMWGKVILTIFSAPDGNLGKIYEIAKDLNGKCKDLSSMIDQVR